MIQAEDIKFIGSWLHHNEEWNSKGYNGYFRWEIEDWFLYAECRIDLENVSPIPLTENIFINSGFHRNAYGLGNNILYFYFRVDGKFIPQISNQILPEIKYIHQLQQLYHSLTGKELDIKL